MTILNWSFPRKDLSRQAQAFQLAQALREEVADLEAAGCRVIQVSCLLLLHLMQACSVCVCLEAARWVACTFVGRSRGLQGQGAVWTAYSNGLLCARRGRATQVCGSGLWPAGRSPLPASCLWCSSLAMFLSGHMYLVSAQEPA